MEMQFKLVKEELENQLTRVQNNLDYYKTQLVMYLDQKIGHINNWIECVKSAICPVELKAEMVIEKNFSQDNFQGKVQCIFFNQSKVYMDKLNQQSSSIKEIEKFGVVFQDSLKAVLQYLTNKYNSQDNKKQVIVQDLPTSPTQRNKFLKVTGTTYQSQECRAIAFNAEGSMMAAGCGKEIQLWDFKQGQLRNSLHVLIGHTNTVTCLVYSKKWNWIASGGLDCHLRTWLQLDDSGWASSNPYQAHRNYVEALVLNEQEDELYSASYDQTIKVWKVDIPQNKITFHQSLEKHITLIYAISVNQSADCLVSCCKNRQILVWEKVKGIWQFSQQVQQSIQDYGYRLCFLDNNTFVWLSQTKGSTYFFQRKDGSFIEQTDLEIAFPRQAQLCQELSPSIFFKEKKMLVQKHQNYIQIIKQSDDRQFYLDFLIDCCYKFIYQGITVDGQYIVIWNSQTKQFSVYKILE